MQKKMFLLLAAAAVAVTSAACTNAQPPQSVSDPTESAASASYQQITQDKAREMMQADDGHIVLDVRHQDEYDSGHIPGAVLVPNESIGTAQPDALPDLDQVILVYCRSGRRSKEAAQKLAEIGYTHVYEFGGILDWTGELVTQETETVREPESVTESAAASETTAVTEAVLQETEENAMKLFIGEREVPVIWENNASVEALQALMPLTIGMSMYGGFEQVGPIGQSIVRDDGQMTTSPGDIVLYQGDQIVLFYGSNAWSYTRLGAIDLPEDELSALLGSENITIRMQ